MNLGEFIIKIGTKGDTKEIENTRKRLEAAEKAYRRYIKMQKELAQTENLEEKEQIKQSYARQEQIEKLKDTEFAQKNLTSSIAKAITTGKIVFATISGMIIALDRLGNSLLKNNQLYTTFNKQTGLSITRLNKMAGVARLSGMNLSAEQVAGDLQSLQQQFLNLRLTGQGAGTFAMLGINPMGMKSDQFILALRQRLKGASEEQKSYFLSQLGISQEWLNVLDLADEDFNNYVELSSKLQLTEEQRKQLAKYTLLQQQNNMRFEYAKQKLLLAAMPLIQKITENVSNIALKISEIFEKNPSWISAVLKILTLLAGNAVFKTISTIAKLFGLTAGVGVFKGIGRVLGKLGTGAALKFAGKQLGKKAAGWAIAEGVNAIPGIGQILSILFNIGMIIWTIWDLIKPFFEKDKQKDNENPEPVDLSAGGHYYKNTNANITNHFHNNPRPADEIANSLFPLIARYNAGTTI